MKKVKSEEPNQSVDAGKVIKRTASYYNFVIFIVIISIGLVASVIVLTNTFINPVADTVQTDQINSTSTFDQMTISKLSQLEKSENNSRYIVSPGVKNDPFSSIVGGNQ
jgi:hypothetical protein